MMHDLPDMRGVNCGPAMLDVPRFAVTDEIRVAVSRRLDPKRKVALGQFMTPSAVAQFMGAMFRKWPDDVALLDPGAGMGSLSEVFAARFLQSCRPGSSLSVTAYEIEPLLIDALRETVGVIEQQGLSRGVNIRSEIVERDFIREGVFALSSGKAPYSHVILNPPYKKIGAKSDYRMLLRREGIETVNLYTAFLALAVSLTKEGGEIVAIVPRSFCNGAYFRPFRQWLLQRIAIRNIHVFESRNKAFRDDEVLQENIIVRLERGAAQSDVMISASHDASFEDYEEKSVDFGEVVKVADRERFIHIPTFEVKANSFLFKHTLRELGLDVATGPVVDFRLRQHWVQEPEKGVAPLLYAHHFADGQVAWPRTHKKPNAVRINDDTRKWLMPKGWYTVTRRFSAKEERRRLVAYVVDPGKLGSEVFGFENHLNVLHANKAGLSPDVARGLAVFLNSTVVDKYFRTFSGHTQVNATDLRSMLFPDEETLIRIGRWAAERTQLSQEAIDECLESSYVTKG